MWIFPYKCPLSAAIQISFHLQTLGILSCCVKHLLLFFNNKKSIRGSQMESMIFLFVTVWWLAKRSGEQESPSLSISVPWAFDLKSLWRDFSGSAVFKTLCFHCRGGAGLIPSGELDPRCQPEKEKSLEAPPCSFLLIQTVPTGRLDMVGLQGKWLGCPTHGKLPQKDPAGTSLVVEWLRLNASNAGGLCLIPGQGIRSHTPQLEILCATAKTWCSQINKQK